MTSQTKKEALLIAQKIRIRRAKNRSVEHRIPVIDQTSGIKCIHLLLFKNKCVSKPYSIFGVSFKKHVCLWNPSLYGHMPLKYYFHNILALTNSLLAKTENPRKWEATDGHAVFDLKIIHLHVWLPIVTTWKIFQDIMSENAL